MHARISGGQAKKGDGQLAKLCYMGHTLMGTVWSPSLEIQTVPQSTGLVSLSRGRFSASSTILPDVVLSRERSEKDRVLSSASSTRNVERIDHRGTNAPTTMIAEKAADGRLVAWINYC